MDPATLLPSWLSTARLPELFRCLARLLRQRSYPRILALHAQTQRSIRDTIDAANGSALEPLSSTPPGQSLSSAPASPPAPSLVHPPRPPLSSLLTPHASIATFALLARGRLPPSSSTSSWPSVHSLLQQFDDTQRRIRQSEAQRLQQSTALHRTASAPLSPARSLLPPYCAYVRCLHWMGEEEQALRLVEHLDQERGERGQRGWSDRNSGVLLQVALREAPVERLVALLTQLVEADTKGRARKGRLTIRHFDGCLERLLASPPSTSSVPHSVSQVWALFRELRLAPSPRTLGLLLHPRLRRCSVQDELLSLLSASTPLPRWFPSYSTSTFVLLLRALAVRGEWDRVFAFLQPQPPPPPQPLRHSSTTSHPSSSTSVVSRATDASPEDGLLSTVRRLLRSTRTAPRGRRSGCERRGEPYMTGDDFASLLLLVVSPAHYHHVARIPSLSTFLALYRVAEEQWAVGGGQRLWLQAVRRSGEWRQSGLTEQLARLHVDLHCQPSYTQPNQQQRRLARLQRALIDAAASTTLPQEMDRVTAILFPSPASPHPPMPPAVSLSVGLHWLEVHLRQSERWPALMATLARLLQADAHTERNRPSTQLRSPSSSPSSLSLPLALVRERSCWLRLCRAAGEQSDSRLPSLLRLVWTSRSSQPQLDDEELAALEQGGGAELSGWVRNMQALRGEGGMEAAIDVIATQAQYAATLP